LTLDTYTHQIDAKFHVKPIFTSRGECEMVLSASLINSTLTYVCMEGANVKRF